MQKKSSLRLRSEVSSGGTVSSFSTTFADVNSAVSNADMVSLGNDFGELLRYTPDYIERIDVLTFSPDETPSD